MIELRPILYLHGILLLLLALAMSIPMTIDLIEHDEDWHVFAQSVFVTAFCGGMLYLTNKGSKQQMNLRQTFIFTSTAYFVLALFSAQPFFYSDISLSIVDAFFESASGITSTGSTVIVGLDAMPPGILLWRSILNALGGVGIVVLAMAILPALQVGGMQLFKSESSETMEKMMPRATQIASTIALILGILTCLCALAYWLAGMNGFDAINHAMATISTGGYSTHDASLGYFNSTSIEWIATLFMLSGAMPIMIYFQMINGSPLALWRNGQVRWLLAIITAASLTLFTLQLWHGATDWHTAFRHSFFSVTSIITTTGFGVTDYTQWGPYAVGIFFIILTIGGCTGSTSGGIKIFRFQILYETAKMQLNRLLHSHGVFVPRYNNRPISAEISASVMSFIILFGASFSLLAVVLSFYGLDFTTAMSASAQALANVGPGLGNIVGPAGNYATLPDGAKWWLSAAMIIGRLELFTVLVLLTPAFWRD